MKISHKKNKQYSNSDFISSFGADTSAVPNWIFYPLIGISLALPNLIYSGISWFDTLHIMKWAWTMIPVAIIALICGISLIIYGGERTKFKIDAFAVLWFVFILWISSQYLWADIFAKSTYWKEWFYVVSLFGAYIFCVNFFKSEKALRVILWLSALNGALNTIFAELLVRRLNEPFWFIMNVPDMYIGNTGQQEMFGLWMAIATFNCMFLFVCYSEKIRENKKLQFRRWASLALMAFDAWGLINSTTRGGYIALIFGVFGLCISIWSSKPRWLFKYIGLAAAVVLVVVGINISASSLGYGRFHLLIEKQEVENVENFGGRKEIWTTSMNVVKMHPIVGVGLGHFKWHYLDAQKETFKTHPDYGWQFTYWAHSEYIQWLAEFGAIGMMMLIFAAVWWIYCFLKMAIYKKELSYMAVYGCAFVLLISFDAVFSRPFHRIENVIWLSAAFAFTNREFLPEKFNNLKLGCDHIYRIIGAAFMATAILAIIFFYSGCRSDKYMRAATLTKDARIQRYDLNEALKSLMGHDEALERMAYHYIAYADVTKSPKDLRIALEAFEKVFRMRPTAQTYVDLLNLAKRAGNWKLYEELLTYLKEDQIIRPQAPKSQQVPASAEGVK